MTTRKTENRRLETGVRNLDDLLHGGLPQGTVTVIAGAPGSGKSILAQQICFRNASPAKRVLYCSTLSESTAKTLRYLTPFSFFDAGKVDEEVRFVDLGVLLQTRELQQAARLVTTEVKKVKPALVVIDSFRTFDDLARSPEELRIFSYELVVQLMAWGVTCLLVGEYGTHDIVTGSSPLFSIADGIIVLSQREQAGEQQRFIQILKMRGTDHSRDEHPFVIRSTGLEVFAPRVTIKREAVDEREPRLKTGITRLDDLLGEGISRGSSLLVSGVSGTGKTALLLEFLYRGAKAGEKGLFFSFEETEQRLRATARGFGWDLDGEIARGMIKIVFIPQPDILVEGHLLMMRERMIAMKARRMALDSASVFLHKIKDPQIAREKVFQLASIVQNVEAVGLFATDIPYGSNQISRFGVEETVVDGIIVLSSTEEGLERHRYLEVYKLRNTAHLKGRHSMVIGPDGITVFPRYGIEQGLVDEGPLPVKAGRLPSGVPGLDMRLGGGLLERSVTLVSGSAGTGKSTIAAQFIAEGVARGEPCLYVSLEESAAQITRAADRLAEPFEDATRSGLAEVLYLPKESARASQLLSVLVEKIRAQKTRRLVIDSLSHLVPNGHTEEDLRKMLFALVLRFRALDVTCLLTMEASSLYSSEEITGRGFSPLADNLLVLRYERLPGEIRPTLTVVKTRGSAHDFGTYCLLIDDRGVRVGARTGERVTAVPADATPPGGGSKRDTEEWAPGVEGDA